MALLLSAILWLSPSWGAAAARLYAQLEQPRPLVLVGALSVYSVGDGYSGRELACGGTFQEHQRHIAIRQWRGRCGARARVCSIATGRCVVTVVRDSGPWGALDRAGQWRCWPRPLPRGWRRRAIVDLTAPLWRDLGRPRFLSLVRIEIGDRT